MSSSSKKTSTVVSDWVAAKEAGQSLDIALKMLANKRKRTRIRSGLRKRTATIPPPPLGDGFPVIQYSSKKNLCICSNCVHKSGPCRLRRCEGKRFDY